jgi:hypothetical protein
MIFEPIIGLYAGHLVSETSKSIFNKIWDVISESHPDIIEITNPLDLTQKVKLIESIIRDINDEIKIHILSPTKSLELALIQMKEIIDNIHINMVDIKNGIEYHNTLWFNSFRKPMYTDQIEILKKNNCILDARLDNLIKVIMLFKNSSRHLISNTNISEIN